MACRVERVDVIDVNAPGGNEPDYTGITFLPGDKVMLADWNNKQCILLSPSYKFLASYRLTEGPADICVVDDQEVALTIKDQNKIQIMSVRNDVISSFRLITTIHNCCGIAAAGKGDMFVTGDCGNNKYHVSLITTSGDVKSSFQYDAPSGFWNFVALDSARTRVYVIMPSMNSLFCFNMDGKKQFTYSPDNLRWPLGVCVDRYDNIYVPGNHSNNIHQLSPDGTVLQLITNGMSITPLAICFHKTKDVFLGTDSSDRRKLFIYYLE